MSSPAAVDPVAQITSPAPEAKAKKPRVSRAKKDDSDKKTESKTVDKESKDKEAKDKKAAPKRKTAGEKHPPFEEIIRECISEAVGDVRDGVSRPAIKKFIESRYGLEMSGLTISNINRAIINGEKKGVFVLPKGASGKVKLAKSTTPEKENSTPTTKSAQRRIAVAKKNAKKEKDAAKAAAKASAPKKVAAPKKAVAAPARQPLKKASTNVKSSTSTATKKAPVAKATKAVKKAPTTKASKPATAKKTAATATERKKKTTKATAAVTKATKAKRESNAASTAGRSGRRASTNKA